MQNEKKVQYLSIFEKNCYHRFLSEMQNVICKITGMRITIARSVFTTLKSKC